MSAEEPEQQEDTLPALYAHCVKAYGLMEFEAREAGLDEEAKMVWEGHLTKLITGQLHLSTPYYTGIMRALRSMGCVQQLRRGGGSSESQWEVITPPTPERWAKLGEKQGRLYTKPVSATEQSDQMIRDLQRRVSRLEQALEIPSS